MRIRIGLIALIVIALTLTGCSNDGKHTVEYVVTGEGGPANNISYVIPTMEGSAPAQANGAVLPWTKSFDIDDKTFAQSVTSVVAQLGQHGTSISCQVKVDGNIVESQTSTGHYAVVTCAAS